MRDIVVLLVLGGACLMRACDAMRDVAARKLSGQVKLVLLLDDIDDKVELVHVRNRVPRDHGIEER